VCESVLATGYEASVRTFGRGTNLNTKLNQARISGRETQKCIPFLQRPSEYNLGRLPLVLLCERDEHRVIELALQKRTVGLNNDIVLFAVFHNRTLLAERMNLAPNVNNM
jgi:hypothetical protein